MAAIIVGVRELKAQFSKYMRQVKAGRSIIITERRTSGWPASAE